MATTRGQGDEVEPPDQGCWGGPIGNRTVAQCAGAVRSPAVRRPASGQATGMATTRGKGNEAQVPAHRHRDTAKRIIGDRWTGRVGGNRVAAARDEQAEEQGADEELRPDELQRTASHTCRPVSRALGALHGPS